MLDAIQVETVIVGAGQCGLSVGHYLQKQGADFVILDEHTRVGDMWRHRYDSLRLYTPARYDGLPGMAFPTRSGEFPTGLQMADYLAAYAAKFDLPIRLGAKVENARPVEGANGRFQVTAGDQTYLAQNIVVAVGSQRVPQVPTFAGKLDPEIRQLHSDDYRNIGQLRDGSVLIVGASHSGADIAMECAPDHHTWLCGPDRGQLPVALEGRATRVLRPALWFAASHVLTMRTPIGRKMRPEIRTTGGPLLRYRREDLERVGVERLENRVSGVENGYPVLDDGTKLEPANVIWCTGYGRDFDWLAVPYPRQGEWPQQERGVVPEIPGLYFMGLLFQFAFTSMLVGGAEREAKHVATHIAKSRKAGRRASQKVAA